MSSKKSDGDEPDDIIFHIPVRRQNLRFGLTVLLVLTALSGILYFASDDLTFLANKVSNQANVLDPEEGSVGNDVTNEKEEEIVDKEMEKLEEKYDPGSNHHPQWPGKDPNFRRKNWTEWSMERMRLNISYTNDSSSNFPSFDKEDFKDFLKNRTKYNLNMTGWRMHPPPPPVRPDEVSNHMETTPTTTLTAVTVSDGIQYDVVSSLWHDTNYFTQGLSYSNGVLYESVGLYGESKVCRLNTENGTSQKCTPIPARYFAEGIQVYGKEGEEKLIQLTWKEGIGWIRDAVTLDILSEFSFTTTRNEGWGIAWDASQNEFIVSDGSEYLHFWDVETLKEKRKVRVQRQSGKPAMSLNELEFTHGKVLANVWYEDIILVIDPVTGTCIQEYDFSNLWSQAKYQKSQGHVLNGISISPKPNIFYLTGKKWERIYEVKLRHFP